jgi:(p)ppGpp synthase/HD superfamily hydrolase
MDEGTATIASLLRALAFAARKHRYQRRKGIESLPYVNHLIEVAETLAVAGVSDSITLQAAVLHDTIEDTDTTPEELDELFGAEVRRVVEEVTDDPGLSSEQQKKEQVEHAPGLSERARVLKIADKISNVRGIADDPPAGWSSTRRREYLQWTARVVAGCRGSNAALESLYDRELDRALRVFSSARA